MSEAAPVTILVVEDDDIIRMLIVDVLEELEYSVLEAGSTGEAWTVLNGLATPIDMMMTDIGLPDGTGTELAKAVLEKYPALPILIASGYADSGDSVPGTQVLGKPFSIDQLRDKVSSMLA